MFGALVALLLLAGCGRKGPLELPPGARQQSSAVPSQGAAPAGAPGSGFDQDDRPVAGAPKKSRFFLDWLLD
jgi:predicted small lipoprotein YifL